MPKLTDRTETTTTPTISDWIHIVVNGVSFKINPDNFLDYLTQDAVVVENEYADIAAMLADQGNQTDTFLQYVADASADPEITSGDAYYEYLGVATADLSDYRLLSAEEQAAIVKGSMRVIDQISANFKAKLKVVYGDGFVATKRKDGGYDLALGAKITADTGTEVSLKYLLGNYCNQASANTNATFTFIDEVLGGKAIILINRATIPTVTSATLIKGSTFIVSTNMYLILHNNGNNVDYWIEQIAP